MNIKNSVLRVDYIGYKQLNWYGHVQRTMDEERLPRRILKWCPPGRRRNSWLLEVTTGMREKGINNMEWVDREDSVHK